MTKKLKLIHLANFNSTNIGNGALIKGLENVFSEDFNKEIGKEARMTIEESFSSKKCAEETYAIYKQILE